MYGLSLLSVLALPCGVSRVDHLFESKSIMSLSGIQCKASVDPSLKCDCIRAGWHCGQEELH